MVVEGKQTSHDSTCLCQIRGNIYDSRTDPSNAPNRALNCKPNVEPSVEVGTEEGVSVCLEPPGSTCPDSVQIVDATVNTSTHKQCQRSSRNRTNDPLITIRLCSPSFNVLPQRLSSTSQKSVLHLVHFEFLALNQLFQNSSSFNPRALPKT